MANDEQGSLENAQFGGSRGHVGTNGGAYIDGGVDTGGGDFVGRDKIVVYREGFTAEEVAELIEKIRRPDQPKTYDGRCPYLGLVSYQEADAELFFGRETLVDELLVRVERSAFVCISGPSGSGKSSLVNAGLLHALRRGRLAGSDKWLIVSMTPRDAPIEQLAQGIARLVGDPNAGDYVRTHSATDPRALHNRVETLLTADSRQRCVIVVDQFEEIFAQTQDEVARNHFVDLITCAAQEKNGRAVIVLALRSDFVTHCARYPQLRSLISGEFQLVGTMPPEELTRAVTMPALEVGISIDPELVSRVIADMKGEPGALPLMQFALKDLFDAQLHKPGDTVVLNLTDYLDRGGLYRALEQHADAVFARLTLLQQDIARHVFSKLVEPGWGTVDTRRTATFSEVIPSEGDPRSVVEVIELLAGLDAQLLTTGVVDRQPGEGGGIPDPEFAQRTVTLAHERLIDAWPWLRRLVDERRQVIALQNEVARDARSWRDHDREVSYLYRGSQLDEVEYRLDTVGFSPLAREFVQASVEFRTAERWKQRRRILTWIGTVGVVVALLAVIGVIIWQIRSPWNRVFDDDQVWALAVTDGTLPTYYLGTKDSGLRRSADGVEWTTLQTGLPKGKGAPGHDIPAVERIAIDGQDSNHLFAFISRHGVYRSLNAGAEWTLAGNGVLTSSDIVDLAVWGDLVLAVSDATDDRGLYVSQNGGQDDWPLIGGKGDKQFGAVYAVHIDSRGDYIYVGAQTGFYRLATLEPITDTSDWQEIDDLPSVISIESAKGHDEIFYLVAANPEGIGSVYRWRLSEPMVERLTDVEEQPRAIVPHPDQTGSVLAYILVSNSRVLALQHTGELVPLGRELSGIALALQVTSHPTEDRLWLLLGHERGLYEYIDRLD